MWIASILIENHQIADIGRFQIENHLVDEDNEQPPNSLRSLAAVKQTVNQIFWMICIVLNQTMNMVNKKIEK